MSRAPGLDRAVADTLLPGEGVWPAGSAVGVDQVIAGLLAPVAPLLGTAFPTADADQREMRLRSAQAADPVSVGRVIEAAYTAYYTDPAVTAILEADHGYPQRPPQPDGYAMAPFDESVLAVVRRRTSLYRTVEEPERPA